MNTKIKNLDSDIAPIEGRAGLSKWAIEASKQDIGWEVKNWSLTGKFHNINTKTSSIAIRGKVIPQADNNPAPGWIEVEALNAEPAIIDLWLVGSRPLPKTNITCICRHPVSKDFLIAATGDSELLLLDGHLESNLTILAKFQLEKPLISMICCGQRLAGLDSSSQKLQMIDIDINHPVPAFLPAEEISLPLSINCLAENDSVSAWGLNLVGDIYRILLPLQKQSGRNIKPLSIAKVGRLGRISFCKENMIGKLDNIFRSVKKMRFHRRRFCNRGSYSGIAFDGLHFWSFHKNESEKSSELLHVYRLDGSLIRSFTSPVESAVSAIHYCHNNLLVLDLENQRLHLYHLADNLQPVSGGSELKKHPGYLSAGTAAADGIHDLCLLYVGGEGSTSIHRYDIPKLLPLTAYLSPSGIVQDTFMDGFLLLAQYSPLLNGRAYGADLPGPPSRQEDWVALFDEYFHPQANLYALENSAQEVELKLGNAKKVTLKVVLCIPTPDPRCIKWNEDGLSMAEEQARIEVTEWAIHELIDRWEKASFNNLQLTGFYYMNEQGAWDDKVLQTFPILCQKVGLRSFAIPGISSAWITEFSRAGFDCVALQSSHAFWKPWCRPPYHLLKCAGRIAREFGMGMEVELPYDVLEPAGQQKLRDYLDMAHIQGWAGSFKAYFQSYNLIKNLAESQVPECRKLYDDLFAISRIGYEATTDPIIRFGDGIDVAWQGNWVNDAGQKHFRVNMEGYRGIFKLTDLTIE